MAKGKKTGGRQPGSPNKVSKAFKTAVLDVFNANGGVVWLSTWGVANPTEFFRIAARLIPHEVIGPGDKGEHLVKQVVDVHESSDPS